MASGGYPGHYQKGFYISGLDNFNQDKNVMIFHAGTKLVDGKVVNNGGRVLGVTALGFSIKEAIENGYNAVSKISWQGVHYRKDIGKKALKYFKS